MLLYVCTLQAGMTALMGAVGSGHTDTVLALTTLGADIHIQDKVSVTRQMYDLCVSLRNTSNSTHSSV